MTRMVGAVILLAMAVGCGDRPGPNVVVEDVVQDLLAPFEPVDAASKAADAPVVVGRITPGEWIRGDGPRPSVVMPAPARVAFRVTTPPGAILTFGAGVGGVKKVESGTSGVRFGVRLDGVERWRRTIAPAATRKDRRWFDERVPLPGGTVTVELTTAVADDGRPAPGVPGFSRLHVLASEAHPRQVAASSAPNVVVLLVDTLRADCVGGTPSLTPNLDALGARGLVFERAIAQSSWTLQSVPSIMTGLLPPSHGVRGTFWDDHDDDALGGDDLPDAIETFAEAAARTGITTVGVSANPIVTRATNLSQGFETFHEFPFDPKTRRFAAATEVNEVFLDWLGRHRDFRFLAYLHYMEPHDPYTPPSMPPAPPDLPAPLARGWVLETARNITFHGGAKLSQQHVDHLHHLYRGEVHAWDATLATLLDGLREAGVLDSTIVVLTSDHGEEFQEHGLLRHGQSLHEELVHVPLVIAGPGVPVGRRTAQVQGIDLYPTLARLLGFQVREGLRGRDLLATSLADATVVSQTDHAVVDGKTVQSISLRTPEWTLLSYPASGRTLLFHRHDDPAEHANRFATDPAGARLVADLQSRLAAAPRAPEHSTGAGDVGERLRALGYAD